MTGRLHVERILCPTDFSDFAARALRQAVALGRWFGSEVTVLHVVPRVLPAGEGVPYVPALLSPDSPFHQQVQEELAQFVEPVRHEPVVIHTRLREGVAWREIEAEARSLPADLIVVGTHGRSGFEHLVLGSVTEKLLRLAPCPILTVCRGPKPSAQRKLFSRIVCAADLSPESAATLSYALSLAEEGETRIILLHVLEERFDPREREVPPEQVVMRREIEAFARERLQAAVPGEAREWCSVEERVVVGKPYREILQVAAEEAADLIVVGAHAQGPLHRLLFGSTASQVVRGAACPVLVVRTREHPTQVEGRKGGVTRPGPPKKPAPPAVQPKGGADRGRGTGGRGRPSGRRSPSGGGAGRPRR